MANPPDLEFKTSKTFLVWMLILVFTFIAAVVTLLTLDTYYYASGRIFMSALLMLVLSVALFEGLRRKDRRLLLWAGIIEFIILLLPIMSFSTQASWMPYWLSSEFIILLPVLWVALPIGLLCLQESDEERIKVIKALVVLAILTGILWTFTSAFRSPNYHLDATGYESIEYYLDWSLLLFMWSVIFLIPIAIWAYADKRLSDKGKAKRKGAAGVVERNLGEVVLVIVVLILLAAGYMMESSYHYADYGGYTVCGDGWCDYDEYGLCPEDCGEMCGDGWCDYDEDYFDTCPEDCDKSVRVSLDKMPDCELTLLMYSTEDEPYTVRYGTRREFTFEDVREDYVYLEILGDGTQSQRTPIIELYPGEEATVNVTLSDKICEEPALYA